MEKRYITIVIVVALFLVILALVGPRYTGYLTANFLDVKINLTTTVYGPSQEFDGNINLTFGELQSDAEITAAVGSNSQSLKLQDIEEVSSAVTTIEESYTVGNDVTPATHDFSEEGTKTLYAVSFEGKPTSVDTSASFSIEGTNADSPKINIINSAGDKSYDWIYIGELTGVYTDLDTSYLYDPIPELEGDIKGSGKEEYCENITFLPSKAYKIRAQVKSVASGSDLRARLREAKPNYNIVKIDNNDVECDLPEPSSTNFEWKECRVNIGVVEQKDYLACVYAKDGSTATTFYKINVEEPNNIIKGVRCTSNSCSKVDYDYFITASKGEYNPVLNGIETFSGEKLKNIFLNKCPYGSETKKCISPVVVYAKTGTVNLKNLNIPYSSSKGGSFTQNKFSEVSHVPGKIKLDGSIEIPLTRFTELQTPSEVGEYELAVQIKDKTKTIKFNVSEVSEVNIIAPSTGYVYQLIKFSPNITLPAGREIINYEWDFGDGTINTSKDPVHMYIQLGDYNVTVTVTDNKGIKSTSEIKTITISSAKEGAAFLVNNTADALLKLKEQITTTQDSGVKAVAELLELEKKVENVSSALSNYALMYNGAESIEGTAPGQAEQTYVSIVTGVNSLRDTLPRDMLVTTINFQPTLNFPQDVPDDVLRQELSESEKTNYKEAIYEFQNNVVVGGQAHSVNITYLSERAEEFKLVKKTVTLSKITKGSIIEYIPKTIITNISAENILTAGYTVVNPDPILKWPAANLEIKYKIFAGNLENLAETKTFVVPSEQEIGLATEFETGPECGDDVCTIGLEDEISCPEDCKKKIAWTWYIILAIVIIIGVYYINFYRGPGNLKDIANFFSVKLTKKRLFTSEQDLANLSGYIRNSLARGISEQQIRQTLTQKGWTKEQIDYAFKKVK